MKKRELAMRLARQAGVSKAEAADQLDRVVHRILSGLRKGKTVPVPGLGRFTPGAPWGFEPEDRPAPPKGGKRARR